MTEISASTDAHNFIFICVVFMCRQEQEYF